MVERGCWTLRRYGHWSLLRVRLQLLLHTHVMFKKFDCRVNVHVLTCGIYACCLRDANATGQHSHLLQIWYWIL